MAYYNFLSNEHLMPQHNPSCRLHSHMVQSQASNIPYITAEFEKSPSTILPGEQFSYSLFLTNHGGFETSDPFYVTVSLPDDVTLAGQPSSSTGNVVITGKPDHFHLTVSGVILIGGTILIIVPVVLSKEAAGGFLPLCRISVKAGNGADEVFISEKNPIFIKSNNQRQMQCR